MGAAEVRSSSFSVEPVTDRLVADTVVNERISDSLSIPFLLLSLRILHVVLYSIDPALRK